MRRRALLTVVLAIAVCAGACGGGDDSEPATSDATAGEATTTSARAPSAREASDDAGETTSATYPVTIEHTFGETTIEARPERIVTLNVQWTDAVLALGHQPVGYVLSAASGESDLYPWQHGILDDATRIDAVDTVPFEQIAALEPDLILVTHLATEASTYSTLEEIAPTITLVSDLEVDPWQDQLEALGRALGEPDRAAEVTAEVEGLVAATAEELPGLAGATYTMANYVPGDGIYVVADPDDGASRLFYGLGMEIDPDVLALDTEAVGRLKISFEQIGLLDADLVGMLLNGTDPATITGLNELAAARDDTLISFELADIIGLNTPTPISVPYLVELMRPTLELVAANR